MKRSRGDELGHRLQDVIDLAGWTGAFGGNRGNQAALAKQPVWPLGLRQSVRVAEQEVARLELRFCRFARLPALAQFVSEIAADA